MSAVEDRGGISVSRRLRQRLEQRRYAISDFVRRWPEFEHEVRAAFERGKFEELPADVRQTIAVVLDLSSDEILEARVVRS